jgi:hypothetical protein
MWWSHGWALFERTLDGWPRFFDGHNSGHIVNKLKGFFHKVPTGYFWEWIVKETKGFFQKVSDEHFGGWIVKEFEGFFHKVSGGHLSEWIGKEIKGSIQKVPRGHLGGYFYKVLSMYLGGIGWVNCFRTHNELNMCPLGKYPLAPSVICQLIAENQFAQDNNCHEARRRQTYPNEILDAFAMEIKSYVGPSADFRSKVLTPILQRQLWGVYDACGPMVRMAVAVGKDKPTIADAKRFYLKDDPTDPGFIPIYRRNLLYNPEARWHLGVVMGIPPPSDSQEYYKKIKTNHDKIMAALQLALEQKQPEDFPEGEIPEGDIRLLSKTEALAILDEGLWDFFGLELRQVVWITYASFPTTSDNWS